MAGNKYLALSGNTKTEVAAVQSSAGAGDAGKIVALDSGGLLDSSMMPSGFGSETITATASEALSAGDFVNLYSNAGTLNVRKADASNTAKMAHGYVLAAVSSSATATIYYGNRNNQVSSKTVGAKQFLSGTTAGATTETAPTTGGYLRQQVGTAYATTSILVEIEEAIILA